MAGQHIHVHVDVSYAIRVWVTRAQDAAFGAASCIFFEAVVRRPSYPIGRFW